MEIDLMEAKLVQVNRGGLKFLKVLVVVWELKLKPFLITLCLLIAQRWLSKWPRQNPAANILNLVMIALILSIGLD